MNNDDDSFIIGYVLVNFDWFNLSLMLLIELDILLSRTE
jgi:hypothetical protein